MAAVRASRGEGGSVHAAVLFARFADETASPLPDYAPDLLDPQHPGSLSHYYDAMSSKQLRMGGGIVSDRHASALPRSQYLAEAGESAGGFGDYVESVIRRSDPAVDWRQYDNDGPDGVADSGDDDGVVDYLFILAQSVPVGFIRGSATGVAGLGFSGYIETDDRARDGRAIRISGSLSFGSLAAEGTFNQTVGTMAHEFGHALGLPDLYDVEYSGPADDSAGIGRWGVMGWGAHGWRAGDGPAVLSAWCLERLGWIGTDNDRLVTVSRDTSGALVEDLRLGGAVLKIPLGLRDDPGWTYEPEYLLLEQRVRTAYSEGIPGEGLLVWHVRPQYRDNGNEAAKVVDLVCADGRWTDAGYPDGRQVGADGGGDNLDHWAHDGTYAAARSGNQGDATDPFDGRRFTRLGPDSNPASRLVALTSSAHRPLSLRMDRRGRAMSVDVQLPRWSGTVDTEVHWAGDILIDGDLLIDPTGSLIVHDRTNIHVTAADRLLSGRDTERVEFVVAGGLRIGDRDPATVIFDAARAGDTWFGVALQPASDQQVDVPSGVRNAIAGVVLPMSPQTRGPSLVSRIDVVDRAGPTRAGNGDGRLSPGEGVHLRVAAENWTLERLKFLALELTWDSPLLNPTWDSPVPDRRLTLAEHFDLSPGGRREVEVPLFLSPEAPADHVVEFAIEARSRAGIILRDTFRVQTVGRNPPHRAVLEIAGRPGVGGTVLVPERGATRIHAQIVGQVSDAYLVLRSMSTGEMVAEEPLRGWLHGAGEARLTAVFTPPGPGLYMARLRLHDSDGSAVYSSEVAHLWADGEGHHTSVVAFIGDQYDTDERNALKVSLTDVLERQGHSVSATGAPAGDAVYRAVLPLYEDPSQLVVWMGREMTPATQEAFRGFLDRGGRLLVASLEMIRSEGVTSLLADKFGAQLQSRRRRRIGAVRTLTPLTTVEFIALHYPLQVLAQAEPILRNYRGEVAGLRYDGGEHRAVFMPLDIGRIETAIAQEILGSAIEYLLDRGPAEKRQHAVEMDQTAITAYPNPFNAQALIGYELMQAGPVRLTVYNMAGQVIRHLVSEWQQPGQHEVRWDGVDDRDLAVGSGIYLISLSADHQYVRKVLLLR